MDYSEIAAAEDETEAPVYSKLPIAVERGEGCWVWDSEGRRYLDLYGGHAVALAGHAHPRVAGAVAEQAQRLLFYSNAVRLEVRARASRALLRHAPGGARVFYVNSGAEANEVALKTARKATGRSVAVAFEGGFHGRTAATLSVCGMDKYVRTGGPALLTEHTRLVPFGDEAALEDAVRDDTACVILEPIQSLAGVYMGAASFYERLRKVTRDRGAMLIFDEIQTGCGRTGSFFFGDALGVYPDMITLAKGMASGLPCAATIFSKEAAAKIEANDHGSTFGAGPLAMAALEATLAVIEAEGLLERAGRMEAALRERLAGVPAVKEVRGRGLLLGIEIDRAARDVVRALRERGVLVGTAAEPHTLRLLPPLTLDEPEVETFGRALEEALK